MHLCMHMLAQLCPTLRNSMNYIAHQAPPSMGILQARILEWVAIPPLEDLFNPVIKSTSPGSPALAGGIYH